MTSTEVTANHLPATVSIDEIVACIQRDGYVIVDNLATEEQMNQLQAELGPYIDATPFGEDEFAGFRTRRTGSVVARSPEGRKLIQHPTVLGVARGIVHKPTYLQLSVTQVISLSPGAPAQSIHRDQLGWDFFPFPVDYDVQFNVLWAMTDYTEELGATRIIPGSHTLPDGSGSSFTEDDVVVAEMKRGSAILYTGKVYHAGGENRTADQVRSALNITYAAGWLRQEENQYLATPPEIAKTLDDDLLELMGYQPGAPFIGFTRDYEHPMVALKDDGVRRTMNMAAANDSVAVNDNQAASAFINKVAADAATN